VDHRDGSSRVRVEGGARVMRHLFDSQDKINEGKSCFLLNMKFCFFKLVFLLFFERGHVNAFYLYDTSKTTMALNTGKDLQLYFWLVNGKNSEENYNFLHSFSTDQSEAELLYFCSLFFSVKKPFQKTKPFLLACRLVSARIRPF
jgi:hypothetical protein